MISLWWRDREWFMHVYTPVGASSPIGGMVSSSPHHLALSVGIRGWRGVAFGWNRPDPAARHRRQNGYREVS